LLAGSKYIFSPSYTSSHTCPRIADYDQDGQPDMLVTTEQGGTYYVNHIRNYLHTTAPIDTVAPFNPLYNSTRPVMWGKYLRFAVGQLTHDSLPDLLIGGQRGGLLTMLNAADLSEPSNTAQAPGTAQPSVLLYPNPSTQANVMLQLVGTTQAATYTITDVAGRQLATGRTLGQTSHLPTAALAPGMYYVTVSVPGSTPQTKALVVQ